MKTIVNILFTCLIIGLNSCSGNDQSEIQQTGSIKSDTISSRTLSKKNTLNDSIYKVVLQKYPDICFYDSVKLKYSYVFQEALVKSFKLVYFNRVQIVDVQKENNAYYVIIKNIYPHVSCKLLLNQQLSEELIPNLGTRITSKSCSCVIRVNKLSPIHNTIKAEVENSESDVTINLDSFFLSYFITGDLVEIF